MTNLLGILTASSASKRLLNLLEHYGIGETVAVCVAMIDDQHLKTFDRKYNVRTSGHVELSETSFDASKLDKATSYGPVNAWGLRKLLQTLDLPNHLPSSILEAVWVEPVLSLRNTGSLKSPVSNWHRNCARLPEKMLLTVKCLRPENFPSKLSKGTSLIIAITRTMTSTLCTVPSH